MSPAPQPPKVVEQIDVEEDPALARMLARRDELKPYAAELTQLNKDIKARMHAAADNDKATRIFAGNVLMKWVNRTDFSVKDWRADHPGDTSYDVVRGRWELGDA